MKPEQQSHFNPLTQTPEQAITPPSLEPRIRVRSSPEEQHLPYEVQLDAKKLGAFMKNIGLTEDQIRKTNVTISYKNDGIAQLGDAIGVLGFVSPFTGDLTINAHNIIRRGEVFKRRFAHDLTHGVTAETLKKERETQEAFRNMLGIFLPEIHDEKENAVPSVSSKLRLDLATKARETGDTETATKQMHEHIERVTNRILQLTVPHELIHTEQVKSGRMLKLQSRMLPHLVGFASTAALMYMGKNKIMERVNPDKALIKQLAGTAGFLALVLPVELWFLREARRAAGFEHEAYADMNRYNEQFADIVRFVPVGSTKKTDQHLVPQRAT